MKQPPLGIMPRRIWEDSVIALHSQERIAELKEASIRYLEANLVIPNEWIFEYNHLIQAQPASKE